MKRILLLRHAKSSWADPSLDDYDRPLNGRGEKDAPRMGALMKAKGLVPDHIICSTAFRARMTAEKVIKASGFDQKCHLDGSIYSDGENAYIKALEPLDDVFDTVMIIGHNNDIEMFLESLCGKYERMPTAALAVIDIPIDRWSAMRFGVKGDLKGLYRPRELG